MLYVRTSLRTLQDGIYNNGHLIENLFRLPKKNLGSFMRVSTVTCLSIFTFRLSIEMFAQSMGS